MASLETRLGFKIPEICPPIFQYNFLLTTLLQTCQFWQLVWGCPSKASRTRIPRERRSWCLLARAPPCFQSLRPPWAPARSGATVFLIHRKSLRCSAARAPPCFFAHQVVLGAPSLGRHRVFKCLRVPFAPARSGATVFFTLRERLE